MAEDLLVLHAAFTRSGPVFHRLLRPVVFCSARSFQATFVSGQLGSSGWSSEVWHPLFRVFRVIRGSPSSYSVKSCPAKTEGSREGRLREFRMVRVFRGKSTTPI